MVMYLTFRPFCIGFTMTDPEISGLVNITDITQTSVLVSWSTLQTQVVDATRVYYRAPVSVEWLSLSAGVTSHTVTSLSPGTQYEFYVQIESYGKNASSNTAPATTAPRIDGICAFVNSTTQSLTFSWQSASSATQYRLMGSGKDETVTENMTTVSDLTPGSRHSFTVWAIGYQELSSNNITCTGRTDPEIFEWINITDITQTSVLVSWSTSQTQVVDAARVYYRVKDSSMWTSLSANGTNHTVTSLSPGTQYEFYVQIESYGKSASYNTTTAITGPFQPGTCNRRSSTSRSMDLYWETAGSANRYEISLIPSSGNPNYQIVVSTEDTNVTVPSLVPGYLYTFYLQSFGSGGGSQKTNCTYGTDPEISKLNISNITQTSLVLKWSTGDTQQVDSLQLYRRTSSLQGEGSDWSSTEVTGTSHTVQGLEPGTTYDFQVKIHSYDRSQHSETATVTTAPRIEGTCSFVTSTKDSVTFMWSDVKSATEYRVVGDGKDEEVTENTVTLNDLTPGSYYTFSVWAVGYQQLVSNAITCRNSTDPEISKVTVSEVTQRSVTLEWSRQLAIVVNASYVYFKKVDDTDAWTSVPAAGTDHTVSSLDPGTEYQLYVEIVSFGKTATSQVFNVTTAPDFRARCRLVAATNSSLSFQWSAVQSAQFYRIVGEPGVDLRTDVAGITVVGLRPGSHYSLVVWAIGSDGLATDNFTCSNSTAGPVGGNPPASHGSDDTFPVIPVAVVVSVGGVLVIVAVIILSCFCHRRREKRRGSSEYETPRTSPSTNGGADTAYTSIGLNQVPSASRYENIPAYPAAASADYEEIPLSGDAGPQLPGVNTYETIRPPAASERPQYASLNIAH